MDPNFLRKTDSLKVQKWLGGGDIIENHFLYRPSEICKCEGNVRVSQSLPVLLRSLSAAILQICSQVPNRVSRAELKIAKSNIRRTAPVNIQFE